MLKKRPYTYLSTTTGMCRKCRKLVKSRIAVRGGSVYQTGLCPTCGSSEALIAKDAKWYMDALKRPATTRRPATATCPVKKGCPYDCGLCTWHESACNLPVVSITNACNLECPICFTYNRKDKSYFMPPAEMRRTVKRLVESEKNLDLINITGGEPTLHPRLPEILESCRHDRIGRITMNTNGLLVAKDESLCLLLKRLKVHVILSFNTLHASVSRKIHGRDIVNSKLKALSNLKRHGVPVTLLNVMIPEVNSGEIGTIIGLTRRFDNILSVTVQTMTYTGMGGGNFMPRRRVPVDESAGMIERGTRKKILRSDFVPLPSAHPLCYLVCYAFKSGKNLIPFKRFLTDDEMRELLGQGYFIRPSDEAETIFRGAIDRVWAQSRNGELTGALKRLILDIYPPGERLTVFERQQRAESHIRTIYLHAHMDEETFDVDRVMKCPDLVPAKDKTLVPACAYNLFYRMKDRNFWRKP